MKRNRTINSVIRPELGIGLMLLTMTIARRPGIVLNSGFFTILFAIIITVPLYIALRRGVVFATKNMRMPFCKIIQRPLLLLPAEIKEIYKNKAAVRAKMYEVRENRKHFSQYLSVINGKENAKIKSKYKDIVAYCETYYDKYAAIYLRNVFQIFAASLKYIDIGHFDIVKFSGLIDSTLKEEIDKLQFSKEISHPDLDAAVAEIKTNSNALKTYLVTLQSKEKMSNISPIIDDAEVSRISSFADTNLVIQDADSLSREYEVFLAESELANSGGNR
ncbi:MAG: hypothetical protein FWG66_14685 [Spirochaetes bacterium]|nr:hypothetical protein [Spirochaetota bacterium]